MQGREEFRWTDEVSASIKSWYLDEGLSASQISARLRELYGAAPSRNAVLGKLWRAGVSARAKPANPKVLVSTSAERRPAVRRQPRVAAIVAEPPPRKFVGGDTLAVDLMTLGAGCKWPIAGAGADALFCGRAKPVGASYCETCAEKAYARKATPAETAAAAAAYKRSLSRLAKVLA